MNVPVVMILAFALVLAVKLRGAQWPHLILGALFAKALTPGGTLDNLLGEGVLLVEQVTTAIVDGTKSLF